MRTAAFSFVLVAGLCLIVRFSTGGAADPDRKEPVRKATGIDKRVLWTTSKIKGSPEPPDPYRTEVVFSKLKFYEPLDMANLPGTDRLAVAERKGKIFTWPND